MVHLTARISLGTKMDQIYLPKSRPPGFGAGEWVEIIPAQKKSTNFYAYRVGQLDSIKTLIADEIFDYFSHLDNVIITGSFLDPGFHFNDLDIILLGAIKPDKAWQEHFQQKLGINTHFICLNRKSLMEGLKTDPLFQMMLSRYLSRKRELFKFKNEFNYKQLDLHLLNSKIMLKNFEILTGREKFRLVRNLLAIRLFLKEAKISPETVDRETETIFGKDAILKLKENLVEKRSFLKKYKQIYDQTFNQIMQGLKNDSKPK